MSQKTLQKTYMATFYAAVSLLLVAFIVMSWPFLLKSWNSASDEGAFLLLGQDIQNSTRMTDGMRHMLLPLILSTFAGTEWFYFTTAKLLSMGFAVTGLILIVTLNSRTFNLTVGVLSMALVVFNRGYWKTMTRVISEPLLLIFFILAYYFWYRGARSNNNKYFWALGAMIGLAYLTKGTAQLLLICFAAWVIITGCWKQWRMIAGFLTAYFIAVSPLLTYNTITWGNPLYNYNSSHALWYDTWNDAYWAPDKSLLTFLATHNITDIFNRFLFGGVYLFDSQGQVIIPMYALALLLAAGGIYLCTQPNIHAAFKPTSTLKDNQPLLNAILIPVVIIPVWIIFFSWFAPVSNFPRHVVPLVPLISTTVSIIFYYALTLLKGRVVQTYFPLAINVTIIGVAILGMVIGWRTLEESFTIWDVYASDRTENKKLDELLQGLESLQPKPVTVISGPSHTIPAWRARSTTLTIHKIPVTCKSITCLKDFINKTEADYLVVDAQMVHHLPFLTQYFKLTRNEDFEMINNFPLMDLMANYKLDHGRRIIIFQSVASQ